MAKQLFSIRVNNCTDRNSIINALVNAGYTVRMEEREIKYEYLKKDYFVVIEESPSMPEYRE
jgi:hypothetical protein